MRFAHWSLPAILLVVGLPAWADTFRCTDASGATLFSDRPCVGSTRVDRAEGTRDAPTGSQAGGGCPPFVPREYHGPGLPTLTYRQPEQVAEMKCEIDATKRNVELQRDRLAKLTTARILPSATQSRGMMAELDDYIYDARANISSEQVHLDQLQYQLQLGPGFPEHRAKLMDWNERCNGVRLNAADAATKQRCAAEARTLGMQ